MALMNTPHAPGTIAGDSIVDQAWRRFGPSALRFATALVGPHDAHDIVTTEFLA